MGFRFSRRLRIVPGLTLNLGKRGVSVSAGVRGAHLTVGSHGIRETVGLPGTGLYYTNAITGGRRARRRVSAAQPAEAGPILSAEAETKLDKLILFVVVSVCIGVLIALATL